MSLTEIIQNKIQQALAPSYIELVNESHKHRADKGGESHFLLVVVSESFMGKRTLARHREIYQILAAEMHDSIHALSLHTFTAQEWQARSEDPSSPNCFGGIKLIR